MNNFRSSLEVLGVSSADSGAPVHRMPRLLVCEPEDVLLPHL
jgi:hypothetical protein